MIDPLAEYRNHLGQFAVPHHRDAETPHLTYWGRVAGLSPDDIIDDARTAGVVGREYETKIRKGWETADRKIKARETAHCAGAARAPYPARRPAVVRNCRPIPGRFPAPAPAAATHGLVRWLIGKGSDIDDMEKLALLSPGPIHGPMARLVETQHLLLLLFGRDELALIRPNKDSRVKAVPGENLRTVDDWLAVPVGDDLGELVGVNPVTGRAGRTTDGKPSFYCLATVADFRHMVFEFDEMPLADQCRFWAGVIRTHALPLVALVYSGGKSIHGVVRVNAKSAEAYRRYADMVAAKFANPADPPEMRLDAQALKNPLTGIRLAGAIRKDTGKRQALLYAAPHWFDREYQLLLNPQARTAEKVEAADRTDPLTSDETDAAASSTAQAATVPDEVADAAPASGSPAPLLTATPGEPLARRCEGCAALADCRQAFGKFWGEKSRNGRGCNFPLGG